MPLEGACVVLGQSRVWESVESGEVDPGVVERCGAAWVGGRGTRERALPEGLEK